MEVQDAGWCCVAVEMSAQQVGHYIQYTSVYCTCLTKQCKHSFPSSMLCFYK